MMNKAELRTYDVGTDPQLSTEEKETVMNFPNDTEHGRISSDVSTVVKWVLSIEESVIEDYRLVDGQIVGITAIIPKGIVKLQGTARKSNQHSGMVSYGPLSVEGETGGDSE